MKILKEFILQNIKNSFETSQRKPKFFLNFYLDVNKDKFEFIFNIMKINMQIREKYIKWGNKHSQKDTK